MELHITAVPLTISGPRGSIGPEWGKQRVRSVVHEANHIWHQANIRIRMTGIVPRTVNMPGLIGGVGAADLPGLTRHLNIRGGVIVALVHRLRGNFHAGLAVVGGRICALQWAPLNRELVGHQGNTLAHELGHILGLRDYVPERRSAPSDVRSQLAARNNLMTSSSADGTHLESFQIERARLSPWAR